MAKSAGEVRFFFALYANCGRRRSLVALMSRLDSNWVFSPRPRPGGTAPSDAYAASAWCRGGKCVEKGRELLGGGTGFWGLDLEGNCPKIVSRRCEGPVARPSSLRWHSTTLGQVELHVELKLPTGNTSSTHMLRMATHGAVPGGISS